MIVPFRGNSGMYWDGNWSLLNMTFVNSCKKWSTPANSRFCLVYTGQTSPFGCNLRFCAISVLHKSVPTQGTQIPSYPGTLVPE